MILMFYRVGLIAALGCFITAESLVPTEVVQTQYGPVQGKVTANGRSFLGIRYAAPPERWRPPKPPSAWKEVRQVIADGPGCVQECSMPAGCPPTLSEDCLFLNVITPSSPSSPSSLPVLVFIHGGAFTVGHGGGKMYNAEFLAGNKSVVYVTMNYRLGVLGFLATMTDGVDGNFGILDQQLALLWVKDNIAKFGGDPNRITISGESAGAQSVAIHMINPPSSSSSIQPSGPVFQQVILQSNPWGGSLRTTSEGQKFAAIFATLVNCPLSNITCLRHVTPRELLRAQIASQPRLVDLHLIQLSEPWGPVIGSQSLPGLTKQPLEHFFSGEFLKLPMLIGSTAQESVLFVYYVFTTPLSRIAAESLVMAVFGFGGNQIIGKYGVNAIDGNDTREVLSTLMSEYTFTCPARAVARHNTAPTFLYMYDYVSLISSKVWGPEYKFCWDAVCHASEVPVVLHTGEQLGTPPPHEVNIEHQLSGYWTNFVHTGNPNKGPTQGLVEWPQYFPPIDQAMRLGAEQKVDYKLNKEKCDFWDIMGYAF